MDTDNHDDTHHRNSRETNVFLRFYWKYGLYVNVNAMYHSKITSFHLIYFLFVLSSRFFTSLILLCLLSHRIVYSNESSTLTDKYIITYRNVSYHITSHAIQQNGLHCSSRNEWNNIENSFRKHTQLYKLMDSAQSPSRTHSRQCRRVNGMVMVMVGIVPALHKFVMRQRMDDAVVVAAADGVDVNALDWF